MAKTLLLFILCVLVFPFIVPAQEYSYSHYGITDGLAGSTVYCITQDKDGFIWTGTEAGVSRFDGTHFKNFTTADGLPDLEVIQIFGDSKGRVWMAPFRKSVCYYYQGKIYNQQNDTLLSRIHLRNNIHDFAEDSEGNILLSDRSRLYILASDGSIAELDSLNHEPVSQILAISRSASGHFLAQTHKKNIEFTRTSYFNLRPTPLPTHINGLSPNEGTMNPQAFFWVDSVGYKIWLFSTNKQIQLPIAIYNFKFITLSLLGDSLAYLNESTGSTEYNVKTGQTKTYLPGIPVSRVFRDQAGDLWFTTMGEGIFRLNSSEWKTIRLSARPGERSMATAITRLGNEIWVGDNHLQVFRYVLPGMDPKPPRPFFIISALRVLYIDTANGRLLSVGDGSAMEGTRDFRYIRALPVPMKSARRINNRDLLVASPLGAFIIDVHDLKIKDTLWHERTTVVYNKKDTFYIGTLNGLYMKIKDRPLVFLGKEIPFLCKRIASITGSDDGTLWIASYDAGIIGYKNNRQTIAITRQHGLSSNTCRTLLVHNNILWVGTDKGLNKIELNKPGYPVTQYTSKDGLASDMVNTLFADSSRIYVGTSAGLNFFDENTKVPSEECRFYLTSLINSERERIADSSNLVIPYSNKRLRIEFAGISYRSASKIIYRYRMTGIDSIWRETKDTYLEYPELPSGNYELQLMAINKFGNQSRIIKVPIAVTIQFWKKPWFVISIWVLSLALLWWLAAWRITRIRRLQREKERLMQKMAEFENKALTSQMNPHFIFNCLNSIQQYLFDGDITASNRYIAGLGKLIRMTLNNSSRSFVSLEEEAAYLSSYLLIEKMRFEDKIDYELVIENDLDRSTVLLPPMLVQPFVENALQHGLHHKQGDKGFVSINVTREKDKLKITIEDNGIGRKAAAHQKKTGLKGSLKEYTSKAMGIMEDRINIMNKLYKGVANIEITDMQENNNSITGTRVVIILPFIEEDTLHS
jgi:ligand-binding sensor domain-containing protein